MFYAIIKDRKVGSTSVQELKDLKYVVNYFSIDEKSAESDMFH